MSLIKSKEDIIALKKAGHMLAEVLTVAKKQAQIGVKLTDLESDIKSHILSLGAKPSFLGYQGYPAASCLSLNEQVVHGIPDGRILKDGDLLGIDVGLWLGSVCVDSALTVYIGENPSKDIQYLLQGTLEATKAGIKAAKAFRRVGVISSTIQTIGEEYDLGIVRALTGHGVGHKVHEEPDVPNIGHPSDGMLLRPGMVLAIEPMFTLGSGDVVTDVDGWSIVTADTTFAAHFEHTVLITEKGPVILTI